MLQYPLQVLSKRVNSCENKDEIYDTFVDILHRARPLIPVSSHTPNQTGLSMSCPHTWKERD